MADVETHKVLKEHKNLSQGGHEDKDYIPLANRCGYLMMLFATGYLLTSEGAHQPAFDIPLGYEGNEQLLRIYPHKLDYRFIDTQVGYVTNDHARRYVPKGSPYKATVHTGTLDEELRRLEEFFKALAEAEFDQERDVHEMFRGMFVGSPSFVTPEHVVRKFPGEEGVAIYTQPGLSVPLAALGFKEQDLRVVGLFFMPIVEHKGKVSSRAHGTIFPLVIPGKR